MTMETFEKNAGSPSGRRRRIMRKFTINEISGVDRPAQEGARAVIMKRDGAPAAETAPEKTDDWIAKGSALTTATDGHTHVFPLVGPPDGVELNAGETSYSEGHSHPWLRTADGRIVLGEVNGHTHDVAEMSKQAGNQEEDQMAEKNEAEKNQEALAKAQAEAETYKRLSELTDAQKAHYETLDDKGKESFLGKSKDERQADVVAIAKARDEDDPVVYKAADGTEYRKSDDPRYVKQAKQHDEDRKEIAELRKANREADLRKRAEEELGNMPGTVETRVSLLKSVDAIEDEDERKAAMDALKAQNADMAKAIETRGHSGGGSPEPAVGSPEAQLDKLAQEYAKEHKVEEAVAYSKVLETKQGQELYEKSIAN